MEDILDLWFLLVERFENLVLYFNSSPWMETLGDLGESERKPTSSPWWIQPEFTGAVIDFSSVFEGRFQHWSITILGVKPSISAILAYIIMYTLSVVYHNKVWDYFCSMCYWIACALSVLFYMTIFCKMNDEFVRNFWLNIFLQI